MSNLKGVHKIFFSAIMSDRKSLQQNGCAKTLVSLIQQGDENLTYFDIKQFKIIWKI